MAYRALFRHPQRDDDTALLIAALDHCWAAYDARINRGLQVVNYYLVAVAVLATAYVSAYNAKIYPVAAVIGASGLGLTTVTLAVGFRQRRMAGVNELALVEVQERLASRLGIGALRMAQKQLPPKGRQVGSVFPAVAFGLAALLSAVSVLYAVIH